MSERRCANPTCDVREQRATTRDGRPTVNLEPASGLCLTCLVARAKLQTTYHSRRESQQGRLVDTRAAAATPRAPGVFDPRAAAARNDD